MMNPVHSSVTIVSGIKASGILHLGNYFGAIRQNIALQTSGEAYYFIANLHALNLVQDAALLRQYTYNIALDYLALGLDPEQAHLFIQSDVPEVSELTWIFNTLMTVPQLERSTSYKDALAKGAAPNHAIFSYPVLMAADILLYGGECVPVGADQQQHLEISRDIARRFNRLYCPESDPLFPIPEAYVQDDVAVIPGTDGRKMSKSYGNTIGIFDEGKILKQAVMSIVTDSSPLEAPKNPETDHVFALLKLLADAEDQARIAQAYRAGGYGYGHAKKELIALLNDYFGDAREKRHALAQHPDDVFDVLQMGAKAARAKAEVMMAQVRERVGILSSTATKSNAEC